MKTPERTVEEIVEEFIKGNITTSDEFREVLQTERQRCEEMMEDERLKTLQECLQECSHEEADHIDDCQSNIRRLIELTYPNNPN